MTDLSLIAITPNLALDIKKNDIKDKVIARLTELKLIDVKYKHSSDILLLVCNLVEHLSNDKKIPKKEIVLDIFQILFNSSSDAERLVLDNNIEFLHSNKAIKKLSRFYLFACGAYEYFFKSKAKKG